MWISLVLKIYSNLRFSVISLVLDLRLLFSVVQIRTISRLFLFSRDLIGSSSLFLLRCGFSVFILGPRRGISDADLYQSRWTCISLAGPEVGSSFVVFNWAWLSFK